ncbi:hypothetical protein CFC21_045012 [Triticum aestivum]|uniref:FYVE-type domain-containing protein n=3 Tax=Triticum TaxID=4564 RepID=A0A9R1FRN5_WHEAT|nr:hypothetical protein CFC21_045012 [Triticum aestivum]CDM87159.1 unnamed protein product [Triticum aestivum]VAH86786.1 unnamed protein product [Triticum turgidum subsp. durum]
MSEKNKKKGVRMAQQELEDLYLGVPDGSVDLTFRDFVVAPPPPPTASVSPAPTCLAPIHEQPNEDDPAAAAETERSNKALLSRTSTNIFTYKVQSSASSDDDDDTTQRHQDTTTPPGFQLSPSPSPPPPARSSRATRSSHAGRSGRPMRRAGIPHSNLCAACSRYMHVFRHRCLVCGRAYCRRCVGAGMGDMTEGRKCLDCLGRKYSHRYIHRAGRGATAAAGLLCLCCCALHAWGSSSSVRAEELLWAEKGPAPRRRPSTSSSTTSISASYSTAAGGGGGYSASMSMTMMSINSGASNSNGHGHRNSNVVVVAPPPASFSRSSANPHAFPL